MSQEDNIENIKFQASETRSRQTDLTYNKFQLMARNIHSKRQIFGLKLINIFGIAFFILIMVLSIVNYSILNNAYVSQQQEILNLDWPSQVQISLQQVVSDLSFQQLTQDTYILNNLFLKNEKNNLTPRLKAQLKNQLSQLKGYVVKHLLMTYPTQQVQDELLSKRIQYQFESKINQFVTIDSTSDYRLEHIVYFMLESVFAVANSTSSFIETNDRLIKDNFENLQASYQNVSKAIEDAINLKFQALNIQAKITFYTILGVAITFFLFFQAIYYYIQQKRNKILKAVCSFTSSSLISMIDSNKQKQVNLEEVLNYSKRSNECIQYNKQLEGAQHFQLQKEKQLFEINEKKNVTRSKKIIQLKQLNIILSFVCLLNLSVIQLYSFSNFILVQSFTQLQVQERLFLNTLTYVQQAMNRSIAYTPILLHLKIYYPQEFEYYYQKYKTEIKQNLALNDNLFQLYSQQQYVNRNNQTFFMYFMNGMFTGDACNITQQYSYYVNGGGYNITDCYLVKDSILSKGMIAALTSQYSYLQQQFEILAQMNIKQFIVNEKVLLQSFSIYQQNQFRVNFQQIFSANKRCIRYQIIGDYQGIIDSNYFYFILQMAISCTIFIFVWMFFFSYFRKQHLQTKLSLDVFDLHSLANNRKLYSQFTQIK
ncbi:transmembrane protein, putative (macronuclear) [Tetrahymena thermophila SB210]|uniref:Transmembrane protein, putative n=1 Tax=Tetrahymena thermophila (strain SB210) TaxID=312017 RepID=I7MHE9_TETTS|nr:transmembrane protein, putative [Tetrahymena thermophila SB210]EAR87471.2 transmembrane protein, putative [Tetrahymena thermophila SB210]|eukprot:XP_001007716.2 transmembrane protein, putative [Tetrahymena thermophila SB210]